jgi:AcrR family transcriptional regulator
MRTEQGLDTRQHILAACARVIAERGIAGATTRAIAEAAGCAEGSLYRYFPDKAAMVHELIHREVPALFELLATLPDRAGTGSVRRNLEEVLGAAVDFYRFILPLIVGVMSAQELLLEQRRHFKETQHGPLRSIRTLAEYIRREQSLGRLSNRVPADNLARLVLGTAFQYSFMVELMGEDDESLGTKERFVKDTIRTLGELLKPRDARIPEEVS